MASFTYVIDEIIKITIDSNCDILIFPSIRLSVLYRRHDGRTVGQAAECIGDDER